VTSTVAFTADALGTTVRVVLTQPDAMTAVAALTRSALAALDAAASRFRDDSELSQANRASGTRTRVGPVMRDATAASLRMARATGGLVDPTVGADVVAAGYDRRFADLDSTTPRTVAPLPARRACWADVVLLPDDSGAWLTVPAGTRLDLGAVAKAWLSDSLAAAATTLVPGGVLVDLGGDLRVTGRPPRDGWVIGLPPGADGQRVIAIQSGGLATSAQDVRRWATTDGPAHHVVDPRTGRPAVSPWRAVSVHAATATEANAASTAALILGEAAPAWLGRQGLSARLVPCDGSPATVVGAWPRPALAEARHG
jgi:thiamine biosynthesis lipoprotein